MDDSQLKTMQEMQQRIEELQQKMKELMLVLQQQQQSKNGPEQEIAQIQETLAAMSGIRREINTMMHAQNEVTQNIIRNIR